MAASELNVSIGLQLRDLNRDIKKMERMFQQASENISAIGNKLVLGITVPLLGIGAAAIKSAGDMEALRLSLETTMGNAGRSVGEARNEFEKLREVGTKPGIDFEEAVKASLRLQGVGMSAERARVTIENLAKAIATAGGNPESLNRVTVQMAQMISKGEVLSSDLNVMKESLPSLSKMMENAFGTTTAEGIRKAGVNADEFVRGITEEMQKMGPAASGIQNGIINMFTSIKQAGAAFGESLNKMFGITEMMDSFGTWMEGLVKSWNELSAGTKETIVQVIAFAAAIGPAFKLVEFGIGVISTLRGAMMALKAAQLAASFAGGGLVATFKALDAAVKTTIIGAIVAVVIALGVAFATTAKEATAAQIAQEKVIDVQKNAAASAETESRKVNDLTDIILSHNRTLKEKQAALTELQKISPEYYGKFGKNISDTKAIAAATAQYTKELVRLETVKAATAEIGKLNTELANLGNTTEVGFLGAASAITSYVTSLGGLGTMSLSDFYNEQKAGNIAKQTDIINAQKTALEGLIDQNSKISDILPSVTQKQEDNGKSAKEAAKQTKAYNEILSDVENTFAKIKLTGADRDTALKDEINAIDNAIGKLLDAGYGPDNPKVKDFAKMLEILKGKQDSPIELPTAKLPKPGDVKISGSIDPELSGTLDVLNANIATTPVIVDPAVAAMEKFRDAVNDLGESWTLTDFSMNQAKASMISGMAELLESFSSGGEAQKAIFGAVESSIVDMTNSGSVNMKDFARNAAASAIKVAKAYAVQGIFAAVSKALQTVPFPFNLIAAGVAAGAAGALLNGLANKISPPKLARGGLAYGQTTAIVGDNPGASVDPEVIAPLSKLKEYMGGGSSEIHGKFRIDGYDLVLAVEKNQRRNSRMR